MSKIFIPVFIAGLALSSCTKKESRADSASTVVADSVTNAVYPEDTLNVIPTGDTTANAVDWNGTYSGTLPCASCPGIETVLILNPDKTYKLKERYLEEKEGLFDSSGSFTFDPSDSFITLRDPKNSSENRIFFIGEGKAWMVSKIGDRDMKTEYQLTKQ